MSAADPLPDARLRDDIATTVFTQAMAGAYGMGDATDRERQTLLEGIALIAFEAAEAFIRTRRLFSGGRR